MGRTALNVHTEAHHSLLSPFTGRVIEMSTACSVPAEQEREREVRRLQLELQARLGPAVVDAGMPMPAHDILSS